MASWKQSRNMGKELVAYLQFNNMLAVQSLRETIVMANPDLLVSKFIRQAALSFVKGLESTEGIAYAALGKGPGGSGFPFVPKKEMKTSDLNFNSRINLRFFTSSCYIPVVVRHGTPCCSTLSFTISCSLLEPEFRCEPCRNGFLPGCWTWAQILPFLKTRFCRSLSLGQPT